MPTVKSIGPLKFFFWSAEGHEPMHIHVERDDKMAKYWLEPVAYASSHGFSVRELNRIERLVVENRDDFVKAWNEHFRI